MNWKRHLVRAEVWYKDGLRFECQRCGSCCSGFSGTVRVSDEEIVVLAHCLGITEAGFRKNYTRIVGYGAISLIEKENKDCVFFERERGCMVYEDRPRQCRTWPFWRYNVYSPSHWKREAKRCPGMNRGQLYPPDLIKELSENDGSSGSLA